MLRRKTISILTCVFVMFGFAVQSQAAEINLKLATLANGQHKFFHKLLEESLTASGHTVRITTADNLPQPRIVAYVEGGELTLHWFLQTKERDNKYVPIDFKVTQGLIGQRVMLIPAGDEAAYANVKNIEDLKALNKTAGLGQGWFDVSVWKENGLKVIEQNGDWKFLYGMVAAQNRGIQYFPRGANEIVIEARDNPKLAIEPNLLLVYPRDLAFYVAKDQAHLKPILEEALKKAEKTGLHKKLIDEFYGPSISSLNLEKRTRISLKNPTSN